MNNTHFKQSLTANLLKKIGITISVTVVTFVILLLYSYEVYHQYIWQEYDLVYQVAQIIKDNLVTISITLIAFDTIIIFWLRYRESLQYIEKMLEAGKTLVADNNYLISLPSVSYTHLRAHETGRNLVCRLLLEKKKKKKNKVNN